METAHKSAKMGSISYSCGKKGPRTEQEYQESILVQQMANCALHISRREGIISATSSNTKVKHLQFKEESKKASTEITTHKVPFFKPYGTHLKKLSQVSKMTRITRCGSKICFRMGCTSKK